MEEIYNILEKFDGVKEISNNCHVKIRRNEVSATQSYIKGKEEGARALASEILKLLKEI